MEDLVKKAQKGDIEAYENLVISLKVIFYRLARARLENEDDIYDAINETVYRAYKNLNKLKNVENFKTWIIRILINECNRIYKKNQKELNLLNKLKENRYNENLNNPIIEIENKLDFEKLIQLLNNDEKVIFVLYFYERYTTLEIAKILKENHSTVRSRLKRGKEKIYKFIEGGIEHEEVL